MTSDGLLTMCRKNQSAEFEFRRLSNFAVYSQHEETFCVNFAFFNSGRVSHFLKSTFRHFHIMKDCTTKSTRIPYRSSLSDRIILTKRTNPHHSKRKTSRSPTKKSDRSFPTPFLFLYSTLPLREKSFHTSSYPFRRACAQRKS